MGKIVKISDSVLRKRLTSFPSEKINKFAIEFLRDVGHSYASWLTGTPSVLTMVLYDLPLVSPIIASSMILWRGVHGPAGASVHVSCAHRKCTFTYKCVHK